MGEEFERIAVLPVGIGQGEEIAALGGAGIVDEDVEPAEARASLLRSVPRRAFAAQIERP